MHNAQSDLDKAPPAKPASVPSPPPMVLFEAIARKLCIVTVYNKTEVTLAPYVLYTRHDELFIDAVTIDREGKPPREFKLGTFKLAGLNDIRLTAREFELQVDFDPASERYAGTTLFAVER